MSAIGITSLAAWGPSEETTKAKGATNRIGAPTPSALLTDVVNVFDCPPESIAAFAAIKATR